MRNFFDGDRPGRAVARSQDRLTLRIELHNLQVVPGSPARLRKTGNGAANLMVHFLPQAFFEKNREGTEDPPRPAAPNPRQTAIELPWRLIISPHSAGRWRHAVTIASPGGRTELWHSRRVAPDPRGGVFEPPARVAVREFERYYTDRTVSEVRAGAPRQRRVGEERLVFTSFFDL